MKTFPSRAARVPGPRRRCAMTADLRAALANDEFMLYYQPIVDAARRVRGAEALLRWRHPRQGCVRPDSFIGAAEKSGLIVPLGEWVMREACAQLARWAAHPDSAHLTLSVNVSARQLGQSAFVDRTLETLADSGVRPELLKLELTESVLVHDLDDVASKMRTLDRRGVGFSLDDFGTGYASLHYLKHLPLRQLKIDRCFVQEACGDAKAAAITRAIAALARNLGIEAVAEGVETAQQRDFMAASGCDLFQGYLFGRPAPTLDGAALAA